MTAVLQAPVIEPEPAPPRAPARARWRTGRAGWPAALAVTLLAGVLRFVRLDLPYNADVAGKVFDEVYYACDALNLLRYGVEHVTEGGDAAGECRPTDGGSFIVHPPLGKWAIALGIRLFGNDTFGWRFAAAVAGTLTVLLVARIGRRLTGSTLLGCLAGLVLALDGLHFVQSRIAMLDVFLVLWTTAASACLLLDRDAVHARLAAGAPSGPRPWRWAAGLCLGAALATKWSAVYYIALLGLLALLWEVAARRSAGVRRPWRTTLRRSAAGLVGAFGLLPVVVYLASWIGWFRSDLGWDRFWARDSPSAWPVPDALRSLWRYHVEMYEFHSRLSSPHPYESHPAGWLLLARPVSYYYPPDLGPGEYGCAAQSCAREVLAIGNPALWWATVPVLLALLWRWVSRRDWRAGALVALVLAAIVPWIRDDLRDRTMFLFYALPAVPFMALAAALVAGWALGGADASRRRRRLGAAGVGLWTASVVLTFAFFYPVLAAQTIPYGAWADRMWFPSWI